MAATKTRSWLRNARRHSTNVGGGAVESVVAPWIPDVTTAPPNTPKPRRRWLQFSLRTNLVFVQCGLAAERVLSESGRLLLFGRVLSVAEPHDEGAGHLDEKNA